VISTEPAMLIESDTQSPFNVGALVELDDFNLEQIDSMNARHGAPLGSGQVNKLFELLRGHPYLSRKALYGLCQARYGFEQMLRDADSENGPFGDHLRALLTRLQRREGLSLQLKAALQSGRCEDQARHRLMAGGLLIEDNGSLRARNNLYDRYFRRVLIG
jgi:hypothetical protein